MRKVFPVLISGMMAVSFSQLAAAQSVGVQGPAGTGANVDLKGATGGSTTVSPDVQNNQQLGSGNQANQQQGSGNQAQNTQQRGTQNQNAQSAGSSSTSQGQRSSTVRAGTSPAAATGFPSYRRAGCDSGHEVEHGGGAPSASSERAQPVKG